MNFEWDPDKARKNVLKHGIRFERALHIFSDPHILTIPDSNHSEEEEREISLGLEPIGQTLVVIHTTRGAGEFEITRLISARKADKVEAEYYYLRRSEP